VPLAEAGFVLELMRAKAAQQVFTDVVPPVPKDLDDVPNRTTDRGHREHAQHDSDELDSLTRPDRLETYSAQTSLNRWVRDSRSIQRVSVLAQPVSSHGNADWDALQVELSAVDDQGRPAAFRGTANATLWGQSQELMRTFSDRYYARPGRLAKIAVWTHKLDSKPIDAVNAAGNVRLTTLGGPHGLAAGPVRFLLPLPSPLPDHDLSRSPIGQLHVQLLVPGVGTFEASQPHVPLRQIDAVRDQRVTESGTSFSPRERTHDGLRRRGATVGRSPVLRPDGGVLTVQP
jgi:hypothetical protein